MVALEISESNDENRLEPENFIRPVSLQTQRVVSEFSFKIFIAGIGLLDCDEGLAKKLGKLVVLPNNSGFMAFFEGTFEESVAFFSKIAEMNSSCRLLHWCENRRRQFEGFVVERATCTNIGFNGETTVGDVARVIRRLLDGDIPSAELLERLLNDWGVSLTDWRRLFEETDEGKVVYPLKGSLFV